MVFQLLELLAAEMTFDEILADYPYLEIQDLQACLLYTAQIANTKSVTFLQAA